MRWRLGLVLVGVLVSGLTVGVFATQGGEGIPRPAPARTDEPDPRPFARTISLPAKATSRRVPYGFLGLSFDGLQLFAQAAPPGSRLLKLPRRGSGSSDRED